MKLDIFCVPWAMDLFSIFCLIGKPMLPRNLETNVFLSMHSNKFCRLLAMEFLQTRKK